jgi:hypothetical protein
VLNPYIFAIGAESQASKGGVDSFLVAPEPRYGVGAEAGFFELGMPHTVLDWLKALWRRCMLLATILTPAVFVHLGIIS